MSAGLGGEREGFWLLVGRASLGLLEGTRPIQFAPISPSISTCGPDMTQPPRPGTSRGKVLGSETGKEPREGSRFSRHRYKHRRFVRNKLECEFKAQ